MKRVKFHPDAKAEFIESALYYESQKSGLGRHFMEAVRDAVSRVQARPAQYRILYSSLRQCRVMRFPYGLIFRSRPNGIEIIAVMHLHRRPGYWRSRIKSRKKDILNQ